jgi:hypothetical protein
MRAQSSASGCQLPLLLPASCLRTAFSMNRDKKWTFAYWPAGRNKTTGWWQHRLGRRLLTAGVCKRCSLACAVCQMLLLLLPP